MPGSEIDAIFRQLLGEHHDHKCLSHLGADCINCRGTGYNQTPCPICDKDGIAFKNIKEAKAKLERLVAAARRDEFERFVALDMRGTLKRLQNVDNYIRRREAELTEGGKETSAPKFPSHKEITGLEEP